MIEKQVIPDEEYFKMFDDYLVRFEDWVSKQTVMKPIIIFYDEYQKIEPENEIGKKYRCQTTANLMKDGLI